VINLTFKRFIKGLEMPSEIMGLCGGQPINDLANDIKSDSEFPATIKTKKQLINYLERRNACSGAIEAAHEAWMLYLKRKAGHKTGVPPIYLCKKKGNILTFKCPICKITHSHGAAGMANNCESHREAHCNDRAAHPDGYYVWYK
jgi:uncharacterized protein YozE (UPF0346 family)